MAQHERTVLQSGAGHRARVRERRAVELTFAATWSRAHAGLGSGDATRVFR